MRAKHLGDQQPEPSGADDRRSHPRLDPHLLDNATGGCQWLDEHRRLVVDRRGDRVQVARRQREELGERAVAPANADNGSNVAMPAAGGAAARALAAANGNLPRHAAPDPGRVFGRRVLDNADELMARHAGEPGVAAQQFQVGAADARRDDANQAFAGGGGPGALLQRQRPIRIEHQRAHDADYRVNSAPPSGVYAVRPEFACKRG